MLLFNKFTQHLIRNTIYQIIDRLYEQSREETKEIEVTKTFLPYELQSIRQSKRFYEWHVLAQEKYRDVHLWRKQDEVSVFLERELRRENRREQNTSGKADEDILFQTFQNHLPVWNTGVRTVLKLTEKRVRCKTELFF